MLTAPLKAHIDDMAHSAPRLDARLLWTRLIHLWVVQDRVLAELIPDLAEKKARAANNSVVPPGRETARRAVDDPLLVMHRKGQIADRLFIAGVELQRLLCAIAVLRGLRSSVPTDVRVDGSGAAGDAEVARLGRVHKWGQLQAMILADERCGRAEVRGDVVRVLELVCGPEGLSVAQVALRGDLGKRNVIAKRLDAGLLVAARFFGIRPDARGSVRVMVDDGVAAETQEVGVDADVAA